MKHSKPMPEDDVPPVRVSVTGWFLVGPTASGKTEVAHALARHMGVGILSADAMSIYRGMDIGTAKPDRKERDAFDYLGVDLADPSRPFSVGAYLSSVRAQFQCRPAADRRRLVSGGTGLYVRALIEGLEGAGPVVPAHRAFTDRLYREGGLLALRRELQRCAPDRLAALRDPDNPRRVARAIEQVMSGAPPESTRTWRARPRGFLVGLRRPAEELACRIERRARRMFAEGLLDEAAGLLARDVPLSATARHAIGYREALAVLEGACSLDAAVERTCIRTRALARRQRTWFRTQAAVHWVDVAEGDAVKETADRVRAAWEKYGPVTFSV